MKANSDATSQGERPVMAEQDHRGERNGVQQKGTSVTEPLEPGTGVQPSAPGSPGHRVGVRELQIPSPYQRMTED